MEFELIPDLKTAACGKFTEWSQHELLIWNLTTIVLFSILRDWKLLEH